MVCLFNMDIKWTEFDKDNLSSVGCRTPYSDSCWCALWCLVWTATWSWAIKISSMTSKKNSFHNLISYACISSLHNKITMAGDAVPYCTVTTLVPTQATQKWQCWCFEVTLLLSWSTYTGTLLKYLRGYSKVTVLLLQRDQHSYFCVGTSAVTEQ